MRKISYSILVLFLLNMATGCFLSKTVSTSKNSNEKDISINPNKIAATNFIIDGKKAEISNNFNDAINNYQKCIEIDPQNSTAYYLLSQIWSKKDLTKSTNYARKAVELNSSEIQYHKNLLYLLKSAKNWKESEDELASLIKLEPLKIDNYFDLANVYIYQNKLDEALKTYAQTESQFGFQEGVVLQRKQIFLNQKKYNKAADEIEKLIEHHPRNTEYYGMAADVYQKMGDTEKAFRYYSKILEISPNNGKVHLAFADYYLLQNKKVESMNELKIAMASADLDIDSKIEVMLKYLELGKTDSTKRADSFELLEIFTKAHPSEPKALAMKADYYNQSGELLKARDAFREVIQFDSTKYLIWEQLVLIEREIGDYPALEKESFRAMNLFPQYSILYYLNATANFKLANFQKAEEVINIGKAFCYSPKQQADFFVLFGKLKAEENEFEIAEKYFSEALKFDPENKSVLREKALLMLKKGMSKTDVANQLIQVCEKEPNNIENWLALSHFYFANGEFENALTSIYKAKTLAKYRSEIYDLEGDILIKTNKQKEAVDSWRKAINTGSYKATEIQTKIKQYER